MTCKCEHWQVCDECRPVRFPKTEDKAMTKELLQQCQAEFEDYADLLKQFNAPVDSCVGGSMIRANSMADKLKQALAQQEQPASVDAYVGAREDAAIWKKRALEAEELNRKFIAELNGPTYLGEPVKQELPASVDAYVGAREDAAIWKKRALEAEELNRKFIAELNGPTYLGEPAQPAQKPDLWKTQFLTDVMTSAGLLRYGRTDKKLAQRIADGSARWRTELYASAPTQPAQEPVSIIRITSKGTTRTTDNDFADCVRSWPDGEYKLYTRPAPTQPALSEEVVRAGFRQTDGYAEFKGMTSWQVWRAAVAWVEAHCRGGANK